VCDIIYWIDWLINGLRRTHTVNSETVGQYHAHVNYRHTHTHTHTINVSRMITSRQAYRRLNVNRTVDSLTKLEGVHALSLYEANDDVIRWMENTATTAITRKMEWKIYAVHATSTPPNSAMRAQRERERQTDRNFLKSQTRFIDLCRIISVTVVKLEYWHQRAHDRHDRTPSR